MEMFVSVEFVLPLLSDWLDAQATLPVSDSLYCNHRYGLLTTSPSALSSTETRSSSPSSY